MVLSRRKHQLCLVPQVLYEFWVVLTRPQDVNGLGLTPAQAKEQVSRVLSLYALLDDDKTLFRIWLDLVAAHGVSGKPAHDTRLIAAMRLHNVSMLLTFNGQDFSRYSGIQVLDPSTLSAPST